ncbi:MAG: universal stress protein [Candidatus Aenigmatarchaeota archaeon]
MYKRVILPTDGSDVSFQGVEEGLEAAKIYGIPALAVYVIPPSAISEKTGVHRFEEYGQEMVDIMWEHQKERAEQVLAEVRKKADELGVELKTEIRDGIPSQEIAEVADRGDIIYICSHGRSGIKSIFIGSTTSRVVKRTDATVAVVKARKEK